MIAKDSFTAYAQYHEDVILMSLLSSVKEGFYVDVGANDESYHSVTKYFYDRGWSGVNIEPIPRLLKKLAKTRPRDLNLNMAVSNRPGSTKFREYLKHDGLSTLDRPRKENAGLPHKDYNVKTSSLQNIFTEHKIKKIDFLKIDVEGFEYEVITSNDWAKYRPTVICVEANKQKRSWSNYLKDKGYLLFLFDGLNEYYIAQESKSITEGFAERASVNAHNALRQHQVAAWESDLARIKFLEDFANKQDALIKSTQHSLAHTEKRLKMAQRFSLKDQPLLRRLKLAAYGLTVDYVRYFASRHAKFLRRNK